LGNGAPSMSEYEAVIGLETHIQLNTNSKIFCGCKADSWADPPNTNICPVCTGLPGVLPVLNRSVVEKAVLLASAMRADSIQSRSYFARKNYFYPDLPKGYQISQYNEPLALGGFMDVPLPEGDQRRVTITKLHMEEDAGKTVLEAGRRLIDFNRCGVPLVEMVTGPDLRSADEAAQYLIRLRQLLRWLGISEADMERGHLRCDANVSIRIQDSDVLNPKTETKNVNSIENVRDAIQAEIKMRVKETEADYRYFREPDLLPIELDETWRDEILSALPELPLERRARIANQYDIPIYDAEILTEERSLADYFEKAVEVYGGEPKTVSNWLMNDVLRIIRSKGVKAGGLQLQPHHLIEIIDMVDEKKITTNTAKSLLDQVEETGNTPIEIVESENLAQVSDEGALRQVIAEVIAGNPDQVKTYRAGKESVIGWFVGQVMRETKGKANPQLVQELLGEMLAGE